MSIEAVYDGSFQGFDRITQERAENANGAQLQGVAQAIVITTPCGDGGKVSVVDIKEAG